jgi:hypothetical protein
MLAPEAWEAGFGPCLQSQALLDPGKQAGPGPVLIH